MTNYARKICAFSWQGCVDSLFGYAAYATVIWNPEPRLSKATRVDSTCVNVFCRSNLQYTACSQWTRQTEYLNSSVIVASTAEQFFVCVPWTTTPSSTLPARRTSSDTDHPCLPPFPSPRNRWATKQRTGPTRHRRLRPKPDSFFCRIVRRTSEMGQHRYHCGWALHFNASE